MHAKRPFALADHPPLQAGAVALVVTLGVLILRGAGLFETMDLKAYDALLRSRPGQAAPDSRIVLIEMTEDDIQRQGRWPITDALLGRVLNHIAEAHPRAVGIDIYRDIEVPPGRDELERHLKDHPSVITVMKVGDSSDRGIDPPGILKGTDRVGFNDVLVDPDGIVRRGLLFLDQGEEVQYAFALRLALLYLEADGIVPVPDPENPDLLRLGQVTLRPFEATDGGYVNADARGYQFMLDYASAKVRPTTLSVTALLEGRVPNSAIKDKVVLIGVNAPSVPDVFHTPFTAGGEAGEIMPGVWLHGQAVGQIIRAGLDGVQPLRVWSEESEMVWIFVWGLLAAALVYLGRSVWSFAALGLVGLAVLAALTVLLFWLNWWVPIVPAAVNWTASAAIITASVLTSEHKHRTMLMQLFSRHVSEEIAEAIWQQRDEFLEGGRPRSQKMIVTVLFSDFKGYTSIAEKMDPQALLDWVNSYLDAMARVISTNGGIVDDYAGDGIKANFGVPVPRRTELEVACEATRAVRCALEMQRRLIELNRTWQAKGFDPVGMRIGVATGEVVLGSLGSADRLKYTTVGDTVNAAARLESLDLEKIPMSAGVPCRILVDERTREYLPDEFLTERIGEVLVKGKQHPLVVYRVTPAGVPVEMNLKPSPHEEQAAS